MTNIQYLLVHEIFSRDTSLRKESFGTLLLLDTSILYRPRASRIFLDHLVCNAVRMFPELRGAVKKFREFFYIDSFVHYELVPHG
jgi:hypothetical protein